MPLRSDCPKCWDCPCECGYEYKNWDLERLKKFIAALQKVVDARQQVTLTNPTYSEFSEAVSQMKAGDVLRVNGDVTAS